MKQNRRDFIKFITSTAYGLSYSSNIFAFAKSSQRIKGISPNFEDDLILADGLDYYVIASEGDKLSDKLMFGANNDYLEIFDISPNELLMWVNHEYLNPLFISGWTRNKANIDKERSMVGGSIIHLTKDSKKWNLKNKSKFNKGVRGDTQIPFNNKVEVRGSNITTGTLGNCAGGKTPWGTVLTCEENYDMFYGERDRETDKISPSTYYKWETFYNNPPEHYGWVVEVDPFKGTAVKHTNLGRFAHECATCAIAKSKNVVVYTGDDHNSEHLYKFISNSENSFDSGMLHVASLEKKKWIPLDWENTPALKNKFKNQLEVHIYCREAAKLVGATPMDRPEDIEINPITKDVFVSLTNNKPNGNYHGQILKISEKNQDHGSLEFEWEYFVQGGGPSALSCPDNMAFDRAGNLWITNDISGSSIGNDTYKKYGHNGLFVIPASGDQKGEIIQIASAPRDAELTGIKFTNDYSNLFISVQHPGEQTKSLDKTTSNWPNKSKLPKSSVVCISGNTLNQIVSR